MSEHLPSEFTPSPPWNATTKLVVSLAVMALLSGLVIYFRNVIGPLLLAFVLTYLLHPLTAWLSQKTRLSWRVSAGVVFVVVVVIILGSLIALGVVVVQQFQSLIRVTQNFITTTLPQFLTDLSTQVYQIGPFEIDFRQIALDPAALSQQIINGLQPILGQAGNLVSTVATGAAGGLGWLMFILWMSYFLLADAGQVPDLLHYIRIPGYDYDIRRLGKELGRTWNAFLRGQVLIIGLVIVASTLLMSMLGVRYALGIGILTGLARLVPYVGPLVTSTLTALVAYWQGSNYFGLEPLYFALLAIGLAFVLDQIFDNLVSPSILGETLGVHPATVLLGAIIAASLIGFTGLILAAPVLATLKILGRYVSRKMFNLEVWTEPETSPEKPNQIQWRELREKIQQRLMKK
ncbi:MAG: AI-2E family transporter [Anaerolineales bacterium]